MESNPVKELRKIGQSVWVDNLSRRMIDSGELKHLIEDVGVTGITSNPTIFQKAISGSKDYDESLRRILARETRDEKELFLGLAMEDVSHAGDQLKPVYEESKGLDGFVSIEVSPDLAYDTEKTIAEAHRLFSTIGKRNILVKVPATKAGLPAIEDLTAEGVNVNVTLLFAVSRYEEVMDAYLRGLERRVRNGMPLHEISSVASFFVSRVDTLADKLLEAHLSSAKSVAEKEKIQGLMGKAAVANAKIAYQKYKKMFTGRRFSSLKGARIQRILWGSTSTKNPKYSDVKYVEELIGPDSINTVPESTLKDFLDHGRVRITLNEGLEEAEKLPAQLKAVGVDLDYVTGELEKEGVKLFSDSYFALLKEIAQKKDSFLSKKV